MFNITGYYSGMVIFWWRSLKAGPGNSINKRPEIYMLLYICTCLRFKLNQSPSPFCWYPQRRCCPRYLKIQGRNRRRHCSLKTKSSLNTERERNSEGLIWLPRETGSRTQKAENDFSHASSLSSSLGRVFREDLVPDWRRRLFAHPFLFLPPGKKTKHTVSSVSLV